MSFSQENGYVPISFDAIVEQVRIGINTQFNTSFTTESFPGTSWYKYLYTLLQNLQENQVKTSEIFSKLQQYILLTNERIQRPSVSFPGLIAAFAASGFIISVKPPADADAGKIFIAVNLDDAALNYATKKLQVCTLIKDFVAAGLVSQGTETESITLTNGQSFDFKFNLPDPTPVLLRLTLVKSENQLIVIPTTEDIRDVLFSNVNSMYRLGLNFEPQRYFMLSDALWAASVLLEWSDDAGSNYYSTVFDADYTDLFTFGLEDIEIVVT